MAKKYYAVKVGSVPGIYDNWEQCKNVVAGYPGAEYKGFNTIEDANEYLGLNNKEKQEDVNPTCCVAYVDGSFNSNTNEYGYGIVLLHGTVFAEICGKGNDNEMASMRNVAGEILGTQKAIEEAILNGFKKIKIHYDYIGIEKWATKEWKRNKPWTIAYSNFINEARNKIEIEFKKVDAHTGNKYNEMADKLAKKGCGVD